MNALGHCCVTLALLTILAAMTTIRVPPYVVWDLPAQVRLYVGAAGVGLAVTALAAFVVDQIARRRSPLSN
jgi:hypothetical protein